MKGTKIFLKKKKTKSANMPRERYRSQYGRERYKDLLEDEYRKKNSRMQDIKTS